MSDNNIRAYVEDVCLIEAENVSHFAPLLLPGARTLIEAQEPAVALGCVLEGTACGALCGYLVGEHFEIISLYVSPDYRRRGVASALFGALLNALKGVTGVISVDFIISSEEHETLAPMLEGYGFKRVPDVTRGFYGTTLEKLVSSDIFEKFYGDEPLTSFSEVGDGILSAAQKQVEAKGFPMPENGFLSPTVDKECSVIHVRKDGVKAYVVIEKSGDKSLLVSGLGSFMNTPAVLMQALHDAILKAMDVYPKETTVIMQPVNEAAKKILALADPGAEIVDRHYEFRVS